MWTFGGLTTLVFIARFAFRLYETPKYLLGKGKNQEAARVVQKVAERDGKETWLTASHFAAIDERLGLQILDSADADENVTKNILHRNLVTIASSSCFPRLDKLCPPPSSLLVVLYWHGVSPV